MVSAARCNAQYSFKTTRLKTFGSHLVYIHLDLYYKDVSRTWYSAISKSWQHCRCKYRNWCRANLHLVQTSSLSFTCLSRKPKETLKEDPRNTHRWLCRFREQAGYFVLWEPTRWRRRCEVITPWECDDLHQESCNFRTVSFRVV